MILVVDRTGGYWRGAIFDDSGGYPIMGATVSLLFTEAGGHFVTSVSNSNGLFSFEGHKDDGYALEVVNGAEKVTIWGDTPFEVDVVTPEMARERRKQEAEATPRLVKTPWYRRMWGLR